MRKTKLRIVRASSRAGRRWIEDLELRSESILEPEVVHRATGIVDRVRRRGDRALLRSVRKFDGLKARRVDDLRLDPSGAERAELPPGFDSALERAIAAVERYHEPMVRSGHRTEEGGIELEEIRRPLRRVGVYVPGGRATYPSSVVMTVVPARLAGVDEIVVATPVRGWNESAALRYTLERLGVAEVWGMGGAHAVAALAYGTESIERVDKIVGPGNAWVTAAKHLVSAEVAIDGLAGPSEVVIVADSSADPAEVAADLLAQAEHDPQALALLLTDDKALARRVRAAVAEQIGVLATSAVAKAALAAQGGALLLDSMDEAEDLVERLAPEHLQLVGAAPEAMADRIRNAGAIFVGASTPEVFGDYLAGPSHVLPTAGTARFSSALSVEDFVRRSHKIRMEPTAAARCAAAAAAFADVEGLPAHAASARLRLRRRDA